MESEKYIELIKNGKTEILLNDLNKGKDDIEYILLQSRWSNLKEDFAKGLISKDQHDVEINRITFILLEKIINYKAKNKEICRFIKSIELSNFANIREKHKIDLNSTTIFIGNNGLGKSMVCELILSLSNVNFLRRWEDRRNNGMGYFNICINEDNIKTIVSPNGKVSYALNNVPYPVIANQFEYIYLYDKFYKNENEEFLKKFSKYFGIRENEIVNIFNEIRNKEKYFIHDIFLDEKKELQVQLRPKGNSLSFYSFSGGERVEIILEVSLRLASIYSTIRPTILIIEEHAIGTLDDGGYNRLIKILQETKMSFQVVLTISSYKSRKLNYLDHTVYEFIEDNGATIIKNAAANNRQDNLS